MAVSTQIIRISCSASKFLQRQSLTTISKRGSAHKYTPISTDFPSNRYTTVYRDLHGPSIEDPGAARDFIYALKPSERSLLYNELRSFEQHDEANGGTYVFNRCKNGRGFKLNLPAAAPPKFLLSFLPLLFHYIDKI